MSDIQILLINAFFWVFVSYLMIKKYSVNNIGVIFFTSYTILSIIAIHLRTLSDGDIYSWVGVNLAPLLFLLFFVFLFSSLLCDVHYNSQYLSHPDAKLMRPIYIGIILFSLLNINEIISNFSTGFVLLATDSSYGQEIYAETTENMVHTKSVSGPASIVGVFSNIAKNLAPLFLCYYLAEKKRNVLLLIGLALSTLVSYMYAISMGMRSVIIQNLLSFLAIYFFMSKFYTAKTRKVAKTMLCVFGGIVVLGFYFITTSRTEYRGDDSSIEFIESYTAQSFLYFGKYGFDNGEQIRNGDRTMPFIKSIFSTDEVARSTYDRRLKYNQMRINESVFVTFVGDFVFDYGVLGGSLVLFLLYLLYRRLLAFRERRILHFDQIAVAYLVMYTLCGFYLYPLSDFAGNIMLLTILMISMLFKLIRTNERVY